MAEQVIRGALEVSSYGLLGTKNQSRIPPGGLILAQNITYEEDTVAKEPGALRVNGSTIPGQVYGGHDYHPSIDQQRTVVALSNGELRADVNNASTFAAVLKTGMTFTDGHVMMIEAGAIAPRLFIFTGRDVVQTLSGNQLVTEDITTPPADWIGTNQPTFGFVHRRRVWGGGNENEPHTLYLSTATDHRDFTPATGQIGPEDGGILTIYPGEHEALIAGIPWRQYVFVFKRPRGIYAVDTRSSDPADWTPDVISQKIGIAGPRAFTFVDSDLIFMDQSGDIHQMSQVTRDSFTTRSFTSDKSMWIKIRELINRAALHTVQMEFYPDKRELHIAAPIAPSTQNNMRIVVDFHEGVSKWRISDRDSCSAMWLRRLNSVDRLMIGDIAGDVYELDQPARNKGGAGYLSRFQTAYSDMSHVDPSFATRSKNYRALEVLFNPKGRHNLFMDVHVDGTFTETVQFDMGDPGFVLDTDRLDFDTLGGSELLYARRRIEGAGRRISVRGRNDNANEDFSVQKVFVLFAPGDEEVE